MRIKLKNDPRIEFWEGNVNEFHEIKDELFPEWIDLAKVPLVLGVNAPERIEKWMNYKKSGMYIYDSTQD